MAKQFAYVLAAVLSAMFLSACNNDGYDFPMPDPAEEANAYVDLCISVVATNSVTPGSSGTRATPNDTTFFQEGIKPYEEINSLRVIMVDENNIVEYNEVIKGREGTSTARIDNITMRTTPGGSRRVYLIANEDAILQLMDKENRVDFTRIKPNTYLAPTTLTSITLTSTQAGQPLFDNGITYVPMSEIFDVPIRELPENWSEQPEIVTQYECMFVTRAASKFSFIIQTGNVQSGEQLQATSPFILGKDYLISNIAIHSVGNNEYLFPRNTIYDPVKSLDFNISNREIIAYRIPDFDLGIANISIPEVLYQDGSANFTIQPENAYGILKANEQIFTYSPPIYFSETKSLSYTIDVTVDWLDGEGNPDLDEEGNPIKEVLSDISLTNMMPNGGFPRNTHVLVILTPGDHSLTATATLVPYIGVELNPEFGFEDLKPAKDSEESEQPEQPEESETE